MKRSEKNNFVQKLNEDLKNSSSVIVTHYAGLSVNETDDLRKSMRNNGGYEYIMNGIHKLEKKHKEHIQVYGEDNDKRLTGKHETASITDFSYGVANRGASIRIPMETSNDGFGYLEDRRPSANMDPYIVCTLLIQTVCAEKLVEA